MLEELNGTRKKGTYAGNRLKKFISRNSFFEPKFRKEAEKGRSSFAKPEKLKGNAISQGIANFLGRKERSEESELEKVPEKLTRITVQGAELRQKELDKQRNR